MTTSSTESMTSPICILWTIRDFQKWFLNEECCVSTHYLRAVKHRNENLFFAFRLWCTESRKLCVRFITQHSTENFELSIKLSLLDNEFRLVHERNKNHTLSKETAAVSFTNFINEDIVLNSDNKLLHDGNLVMYFEMTIDTSSQFKQLCATEAYNLEDARHLLLEKEYFSDFTVHVKDTKFLCHKCMLACRCEYFAAMFRSSLKENDESKLVLTDMEPNIFEKLLCYIYTGKADVSEADAFQLLIAADKYSLERLKSVCEEKIHSSLCLENALITFSFASVHSLESLKLEAFLIVRDFIHVSVLQFLSKLAGNLNGETDFISGKSIPIEDSMQDLSDNLVAIPELPIGKFLRNETGSKKTFLPKADVWCRTDLILLGKGVWTIKRFRKQDFSTSKTISSYTFDCDGVNWEIEARIRIFSYRCRHLDLYLHYTYASSKALLTGTQYKFSIINKENMETNTVAGSCQESDRIFLKIDFCNNVDDLLSSNELLHDDDLIVCCRFFTPRSNWCSIKPRPSVPECRLLDHISSLLRNELFVDLFIKIGSETFPCHKAIVSCHSPFLYSLVQQSNSQNAMVLIDDIKPTTFKKVLTAMYSGKCKLSAPEVWELLTLENKYRLFSTTSTFDEAFISALSAADALKALTLATSQKIMKLQKYAVQFISQNSENVIETGLTQ